MTIRQKTSFSKKHFISSCFAVLTHVTLFETKTNISGEIQKLVFSTRPFGMTEQMFSPQHYWAPLFALTSRLLTLQLPQWHKVAGQFSDTWMFADLNYSLDFRCYFSLKQIIIIFIINTPTLSQTCGWSETFRCLLKLLFLMPKWLVFKVINFLLTLQRLTNRAL